MSPIQKKQPVVSARVLWRNWIIPWLGLFLALLLGAYAVTLYFADGQRRKKPVHLVATAGSFSGTRGKIADLLNSGLEEFEKITLEVRPSAGSVAALEMVNRGEIDLALIQGGLRLAEYPNVRLAAVLHVEPLHLLIKGVDPEEVDAAPLEFLRGKRVNLGAKGSGTRKFASELLAFARLNPETDFEATPFTYDQLMEMQDQDLPDAVFTVSSQPSPVVGQLIAERGFRLVSLPYADSMRINGLYDSKSQIDRRQVVSGTIPPFLYSLEPPRPESEIETIGVPLLVVANQDCDDDSIRRICEHVYGLGFTRSFYGKVDITEISKIASSILHPGAQQYLDSRTPASTQQVIEITDQLVAIAGSSLGTLLFLWQWIKRRREKRRDLEFVQHIERVVEIENMAIRYESTQDLTVDDLMDLQNELVGIKTGLIEQYKTGSLEGADMLSAFLKHVNDTSELISNIVLHESEPKSK